MEARWIDVREYPEFAGGHIEGSELIPLGTLGRASEAWDRTAPLTLVCRTGRRAEDARQILERKGWRQTTRPPPWASCRRVGEGITRGA